jgi:hypothetical protein
MPGFLELAPSPVSKAPFIFRLFQFTLCGPYGRDQKAKRFICSPQPTEENKVFLTPVGTIPAFWLLHRPP